MFHTKVCDFNLPNMKKPNVSILIPVYNGEKTLRKCISSILNQSYKNFELIIVDNNSTDKTKEIIIDFQKNNKNIAYVFEKNRGRGSARNAGIRNSRGEIILMTDSDCIVPENWINKMIEPVINQGEHAVMGFEEDIIGNYWTRNIQESNLEFIRSHEKNNYVTCLDTKNFAIKTSIMKKFLFDENLGNIEDYDLALRMRNKIKVRFIEEVKLKHYHKASFSSWVKLQFNRAYWNSKIYKKHRNYIDFKDEIMMKDFYIKYNLFLLPWVCKVLTTKHKCNKFFLVSSGIAWKLGSLYGRIFK